MKNKTAAVIFSIAVLLLAFIVFLEKGTMSTSERDERQKHVFVEYVADRVERFEITNAASQTVTVEATGDVLTDQKKWTITSPLRLDADPSEIQTILSAMDYVLKERTVQGKGRANDPKYGLEKPRILAAFTANGVTTSFRIGGNAQGNKVYLALEQTTDELYAVDKEFFESMNKTRDDLRSKKIVSRMLQDARRIEVTRPESRIHLQRVKHDPWQIVVDGTTILAENSQVNELLQAIGDLRATRFIADGLSKESLGAYGLSNPDTSMVVHLPKEETITVLVGTSCPEQNHQRYVTMAGSGTVTCVKDDFLPIVERPASRLTETRPAVFENDAVASITIVRNNQTLKMTREEGAWIAATQDAPPLEQAAVEELLRVLKETKASKIEVVDGEVGRLGRPSARITLNMVDSRDAIELNLFFDPTQETVKLQRSKESAVLTLPSELRDTVRSDALAFRIRTLSNGDLHDVESLHIKGAVTQKVDKHEGLWTLTAPMAIAADGDAARRLAELITTITVPRFVSEKARTEHGLENPFAVITATLAQATFDDKGQKDQTQSKEVVLQLGAKAGDNGRFARLGGNDQTVFIVGPEYEQAIQYPFVARDLMQIDETKLDQLALALPGREVVLKKIGNTWSATDKRQLDATRLKRVLADLSTMKTVRAHSFGTANAAFGKTTLVITATSSHDPEKTRVITVGPRSRDNKENGYLAHLDGLGVTLVMPARIIEELLVFTEPR